MKRIAIVGGGIAGLTAACELARLARTGAPVEAVLFESSNRPGGLIETVREGGFTVEAGPDAWVSAKPWARDLAVELGLDSELIPSNDAARKTHIFLATPENPSGRLVPMPDGFNLMVPTNLDALEGSPLFSPEAIAAYRAEPARAAELLASIPTHDESVADFTLRHFGPEVLARVAAPLLSGVFGGDVRRLSVRAVMPAFVQMERTHGSLITALSSSQPVTDNLQPAPVFTTLRSGLGTLIDRLVAAVPPHWLRLNTPVTAITPAGSRKPAAEISPSCRALWTVTTSNSVRQHTPETFDAVLLATPLDAARRLLAPLDDAAAQLLPTESSSAVLVAFAYPDATRFPLPPGFGFLVPPSSAPPSSAPPNSAPPGSAPPGSPDPSSSRPELPSSRPEPNPSYGRQSEQSSESRYFDSDLVTETASTTPSLLLACTFTDQKFPHRVPPGGRLVRAFFGGPAADRIARCNNDEIAAIARLELARILNTTTPISAPPLTPPLPVLTVVRRWPNSLPQYSVGHLSRAAELESRLGNLPSLTLLGNTLHGVGLPDLIRAARQAARAAATSE
jgi:protoporphyrinogen/coproporphyrinogen III oxidase